ncbi:MAG: S1C family serine protease, partial [Tepidisphaeraceae bacterium]
AKPPQDASGSQNDGRFEWHAQAVHADGSVAASAMVRLRGGKKEMVPFLGVVCTPVDPAMREQLKLPRGVGLVVSSVEEKSGAAEAGLKPYDILNKLDDQLLVTSQQLGVLVRMHKAGDEVTLSIIREGQPMTLKAKLGEKEMVVSDASMGESAPTLFGATGDVAFTLPTPPSAGDFKVLFQNIDDDDADLVYQDNQNTLKVYNKDGDKKLVATDSDGKTVFEGPINTEEQRKAVPADIAAKLDKIDDQIQKLPAQGSGQHIKIRIKNND